MRKTELIVSGEVIHPKTKASIVGHEHTNIEAYLDQQNRTSSTITQSSAMSQVGVGDDMDLSFCVEDGFYESATFYGKTLVNRIQEPSSQDIVLPYEFEDGQYVTINDTKESGALGVELKGQTLVNLASVATLSSKDGGSGTFVNGKLRVDFANYRWSGVCFLNNGIMKPSTEYTLIAKATNTTSFSIEIGHNNSFYNAFTPINLSRLVLGAGESSSIKVALTTRDDLQSNAVFYNIMASENPASYSGNKFIDIELIILEGNYTNVDIPFFTGMASCKMPSLHTVGNLFDAQKVISNSAFSYSHSTDTGRFEFTNRGDVVANTNIQLPAGTYDISFLIRGVCDNGRAAITFAKDGEAWHGCSRVEIYYGQFGSTTFKEVKSQRTFDAPVTVTLVGHAWAGGATGSGWCEFKDIRFTPVGKTSILSLPEEVVLRSLPNGVCDTFNTRTGVYTQKIGELVFDGSEAWESWRTHEQDEVVVGIGIRLPFHKIVQKPKRASFCVCDKLRAGNNSNNDNAWYNYNYNIAVMYPNANTGDLIAIGLPLTDLSSAKNWLEQNPTTIQYELAEPIITKINLPSTLKSWNTTTHVYSEIPENTLYPILSHSNPTYPVILKPSTKYSIVANSYSNGHTNSSINFNLGGATASTTVGNRVTTITTPSTLSNELLTMSGRGNKLNHVMVIEGGVVGDEPYFEGICDCKSPILLNVGKNLFDDNEFYRSWKNSNASYIYEEVVDGEKVFRVFDGSALYYRGGYEIRVKRGQRYTFKVTLKQYNSAVSNNVIILQNGETRVGNLAHAFCCNSSTWVTREVTFVAEEDFIRIGSGYNGGNYFYAKDMSLTPISDDNSYEPYKSNILSCNGDKIELTADMFEQGNVGDSDKAGSTYEETKKTSNSRIRLISLLSVKPNTTYHMSCDSNYKMGVRLFDVNGLFTGEYHEWYDDFAFTTNSNTKYVTIKMKKNDNATITPTIISEAQPELREVDKTIVLRSLPNGVCDTLNVETGEYVQRIGEVTFDGSNDENWKMITEANNWTNGMKNILTFNYPKPSNCALAWSKAENEFAYLSNKFPSVQSVDKYAKEDKEKLMFDQVDIKMATLKSKLNTQDLVGFKAWLQSNPVTVQYELATPIISTIDIQGFPYAYTNGHVQLSSGSIEQSLTPKVEYVVQTNRAGAIQANQDRLLNHDKRLAMLEDLVLHQLIQLEYNRAKCTFLSQTRQIFEGGIQMYHTKYELLSEFIEKKLYRSLEEVFEMLDVYFMLGDITDGEYDALYEALMPSAEEIFEVEETFDHEDVEV